MKMADTSLKQYFPNSKNGFAYFWFVTQSTFTCSSQQCKHQNNLWNLLQVNNKDTKTMSLSSLGCFFVKFEQISLIFLEFSLLTWNKQVTAGYKIAKKRQQNLFTLLLKPMPSWPSGNQSITKISEKKLFVDEVIKAFVCYFLSNFFPTKW